MKRNLKRHPRASRAPRLEHLESRQLLAVDTPWERPVETEFFGDEFVSTPAGTLFAGYDAEHGQELWIHSGSPSTARMLRDLTQGPEGSNIEQMVAAENYAYFVTSGSSGHPDYARTQTLWVSDGTSAGTRSLYETRGKLENLTTVGEQVLATESSKSFAPCRFCEQVIANRHPDEFAFSGANAIWREESVNATPIHARSDAHAFFVLNDTAYFVTHDRNSDTGRSTILKIEGTEVSEVTEFESYRDVRIHNIIHRGNETLFVLEYSPGLVDQLLLVNSLGDSRPLLDPALLSLPCSQMVASANQHYFTALNSQSYLQLFKTTGNDFTIEQVDLPDGVTGISHQSPVYATSDRILVNVDLVNNGGIGIGVYIPDENRWTVVRSDDGVGSDAVLAGNEILFWRGGPSQIKRLVAFDFHAFETRELESSRSLTTPPIVVDGKAYLVRYHDFPLTPEDPRSLWQVEIRRDAGGNSTEQVAKFDLAAGFTVQLKQSHDGSLFATIDTPTENSILRFNDSLDQFLPIASVKQWIHTRQFSLSVASHRNAKRLNESQFVFKANHPTGDVLYLSDGTELGTKILISRSAYLSAGSAYGSDRLGIERFDVIDSHVYVTTRRHDASSPTGYSHDIWTTSLTGRSDDIFRSSDQSFLYNVLGVVEGRLIYATQSTDTSTQTLWSAGTRARDSNNAVKLADGLGSVETSVAISQLNSNQQLYFEVGPPIDRSEAVPFPQEDFTLQARLHSSLDLWVTFGSEESTRIVDTESFPAKLRDYLHESPSPIRLIGQTGQAWYFRSLYDDHGYIQVFRWDAASERPEPVVLPMLERYGNLHVTDDAFFYRSQSLSNHSVNFMRFDMLSGITEPFRVPTTSVDADLLRILNLQYNDFLDIDWFATGKRYVTDGTNQLSVPPNDSRSTSVLFADRYLLVDELRLQNQHESIQLRTTDQNWLLTATETQLIAIGNNRFQALAESIDVTLAFLEQAKNIQIDVDSFANGRTKRLALEVGPETTITLNGQSPKEVRYVDRGDHLLIMLPGIEVTIPKQHSIQIVENLGQVIRQFYTGNGDDYAELVHENQTHLARVVNGTGHWTVEFQDTLGMSHAPEMTDSSFSFALGAGNDQFHVDARFGTEIHPIHHPRTTTINVLDDLNGIDAFSVDLAASFEAIQTSYSEVVYENNGNVRLHLGPTNHIMKNVVSASDINLDGQTTPRDALSVINYLAKTSNQQSELSPRDSKFRMDVNGDNSVSPMDALLVINALARAERFASAVPVLGDSDDDDNLIEVIDEAFSTSFIF